jgi:tetratricopeptide (TPR) repeat protein
LLVDWAANNAEQSIFWLSGLGGVGKTTVIKSVCDKLAKLGVLGAAFFISRSSAERTNPQNIVRSIVHQLAYYQPLLRPAICEAIRKDPMIVSKAMLFQISALLYKPLRLCAISLKHPIVLVIDALDECDKDDSGRFGSDLLPLLLSTFSGSSLPVKILVTSRVERSIQNMFSQTKPAQFRLHRIDQSIVRADIRLYLEYNFRAIAIQCIIGCEDSWPGKGIIDHITDLSGGLFIFAVTVIKYVRHPRHLPNTRLNELLARKLENKHKSAPSFDDLDKLYTHVLQSALGDDTRYHDELSQRLRMLLGVLMVLFEPLSVASLACLLDCSDELLRLDLESLSAVILVPEEGSTDTIQFFHASFQDYLLDPSRCTDPRFHIGGTQEFHELVAVRGFELQLGHLKDNKQNRLSASNNKIPPYILHHVAKHRDMLNVIGMKKVISIQQACLLCCKAEHPDLPNLISGLGRSLLFCFERGGGSEFLEMAIRRGREALDLCPPGHLTRDTSLINLANALLRRFEQTDEAHILAEAIGLYRESLELRPLGHPYRDSSLNNLANALLMQFEQTDVASILTEAIGLHRESLELCPPGHPNRDNSLHNLANTLQSQFKQTGGTHVLAEAIDLHRESLALCPPGHPTRDISLIDLGIALKAQFEDDRKLSTLEEAIHLTREALKLWPSGHRYRQDGLTQLASLLEIYSSEVEDSQASIEIERLRSEAGTISALCKHGADL